MLTAEIKINGVMIAHVYAVNKGLVPRTTEKKAHPFCGEFCTYAYEYYRPEHTVIRGKVEHFRPNGAAALLKEICEDIEGKGGK